MVAILSPWANIHEMIQNKTVTQVHCCHRDSGPLQDSDQELQVVLVSTLGILNFVDEGMSNRLSRKTYTTDVLACLANTRLPVFSS